MTCSSFVFSQSFEAETESAPLPKPPSIPAPQEMNFSIGFTDLNGKQYFNVIFFTSVCCFTKLFPQKGSIHQVLLLGGN